MDKDKILLNYNLYENADKVFKLLKKYYWIKKIHIPYFHVINPFNTTDSKINNYTGLIMRIDIDRYVILYIDEYTLNETLIMHIITEYQINSGDSSIREINIDKIPINIKDLQ